MKKTLIMTLLVASTTVFSQGLIGPKVGINLNSNSTTSPNYIQQYSLVYDETTFTDTTINSSSITPSLGIVFNVQIGKYFAIRPEVLWVQRTAKQFQDYQFFGAVYDRDIVSLTMNYIEVPLNLVGRYPIGPGKIEVFAGLAAGYNLGGKYTSRQSHGKVKGQDYPKNASHFNYAVPVDNTRYTNKLNFSLNFGLGYNWKGLIFQVGYNLGLSNMAARSEEYPDEIIITTYRDQHPIKSSAVTIGVAYLIGKKE